MKKLVTILAIALCSTLAMAQTNQYFWYNGNLIMGNPINQVDSITFGQIDDVDSITLYLPHTIKVVHDTVYVTVHDTINPCDIPDGAISGKFSVSPTKQVYFSKGNLQYQASTNTWRFAENQWDYVGADNANISSTYNGWIDLFGWGTGDNPTNCSYYNSDYATFSDFGNNDIENTSDGWYTMSKEEWIYLLQRRNNADNLKTRCFVNGELGLLLLPDNWKNSQELSIKVDTLGISNVTFNLDQWKILNQKGCAFLPAAGWRNILSIDAIGNNGAYLTSTPDGSNYSFELCIGDSFVEEYLVFCLVKSDSTDFSCRRTGRSVRLVQEVK